MRILGTPRLSRNCILFGITGLVPEDVGEWIGQHIDRDNFYLDAVDERFLRQLETYLCGTFGSDASVVAGRAALKSAQQVNWTDVRLLVELYSFWR